MCALDKSHARLMTFLNTREINSMLDYDTLDIGYIITASPVRVVNRSIFLRCLCGQNQLSLGARMMLYHWAAMKTGLNRFRIARWTVF
jgi:hypothetical protein